MKTSPKDLSLPRSVWMYLTCIAFLFFYSGCKKVPDYLPTLHITTVASGLVAPVGLETDANGNFWICEAGTGNNDANDTHPYNLTKGPDGDLYISDAGANGIIHRKSAGQYSVLAEIPGIANPLPIGPPQIQSVPTGILYDGHDFLVTTVLGFPFP